MIIQLIELLMPDIIIVLMGIEILAFVLMFSVLAALWKYILE